MTITVFGATTIVGMELIRQGLILGHQLRAFGRNIYTADIPENEDVELIPGALFDAGQVWDAINGSHAVVSVIEGGIDGTDKTRSLGMKNITTQMQKASVKRIIAMGSIGQLDATDDEIIMNSAGFPKKMFAVNVEHYKSYQLLKQSSLDWTFVCPPEIIAAQATGNYHTLADRLPVPNNNTVNSGDLAMFMLSELNKNEYLKKRVGISN